ncbi:MAG TPA: carboxypeptidase regulatory-like domain-containing protein [Labilithrix sp.]|jgi:hypothetical protein
MSLRTFFAAAFGAGLVLAAACGSSRSSDFGTGDDGGSSGSSGSSSFGGSSGMGEAAAPCKGLECQQVACPGGGTTSLTGTVYAPTPAQFGKADPIYNAIVYVPNADLQPFPKGVTCDKCGAVTSGDPVAVALSGADGTFKLDNVPVGDNIPLVVQVGRWRRKVTIPHVAQCTSTPLDAETTRLPRTQMEGDIPLMAIVSSYFDPTQCIMRKIGVDDSEFTAPSGTGRIHLYQGTTGGMGLKGATLPSGNTLWGDASNPSKLKDYDIVATPCLSNPQDMTGRTNIQDYTNSGGRQYITDLSVDIMSSGPAPWPSLATWTNGGVGSTTATIDQSFPKGQALASWLQTIGATKTKGSVDLEDVYYRFTSTTQQRWAYDATNPLIMSFNTPVDKAPADQCGRAIYASFHVATPLSGTFPDSCPVEPLTAQERILEFMLFDLASCVIKDDTPPTPPPTVN